MWAGEMAPQLTANSALATLTAGGSQLPITPAPGDLMLSFGLCRHCTHVHIQAYMYIIKK